MQGNPLCPFCNQEPNTITYSLLTCNNARAHHNSSTVKPRSDAVRSLGKTIFTDFNHLSKEKMGTLATTLWVTWKQRNAMVWTSKNPPALVAFGGSGTEGEPYDINIVHVDGSSSVLVSIWKLPFLELLCSIILFFTFSSFKIMLSFKVVGCMIIKNKLHVSIIILDVLLSKKKKNHFGCFMIFKINNNNDYYIKYSNPISKKTKLLCYIF